MAKQMVKTCQNIVMFGVVSSHVATVINNFHQLEGFSKAQI